MAPRAHTRVRPYVGALAAFAVAVAATPAAANPVLLYGKRHEPVVFDAEVAMLVAIGIAIEWAIFRALLRAHVRSEARLAALVALANLVSYPITLGVADLLVSSDATQRLLGAESAAVGVEFLVYVVVALGFERTTPLRPGASGLRILGATLAGNAATAMLGLAYMGIRVGGN